MRLQHLLLSMLLPANSTSLAPHPSLLSPALKCLTLAASLTSKPVATLQYWYSCIYHQPSQSSLEKTYSKLLPWFNNPLGFPMHFQAALGKPNIMASIQRCCFRTKPWTPSLAEKIPACISCKTWCVLGCWGALDGFVLGPEAPGIHVPGRRDNSYVTVEEILPSVCPQKCRVVLGWYTNSI